MSTRIKRIKTFAPIYSATERYMLLIGGAGSGKSVAAAQFCILQALQGQRVIAMRKVGRTLRLSVWQTLIDMLAEMPQVLATATVLKGSMTLHFPNNGAIYCLGIDDPEKVKSIRDPSIIWMEEATEFDLPDFEELDRRLRTAKGKNQILATLNPISKRNWVYRTFIQSESYADRTRVIHSTYQNNPFLPDSYRETIERLVGRAATIYREGDWPERQEGLIYEDYKIVPHMPEGQQTYGLDWGFADPMAIIGVLIQNKDLYVDEVVYQTHLTTEDLIKRAPLPRSARIYCDHSPNDIAMLSQHYPYATKATKGAGSKLAAIRAVHGYDLNVTAKSKNLIRELNAYAWAKDRHGETLDQPVDGFDHAIDAMHYALIGKTRNSGDVGFGELEPLTYL